MTLPDLPDAIVVNGGRWPVSRAWPEDADRIAVEARLVQIIRAGYWDGREAVIFAPGTDPGLPGLADAVAQTGGTVISHRAGKRAVVRGQDGHYTKVVRRKRAAKILLGMTRAAAFRKAFRTPELIGHDASSVTLSAVLGRSLHEAHGWSDDHWRLAWEDTLTAWRTAVSMGVDGSDEAMPVHDVAAEIRVLNDWADKAESTTVLAPERLRRARERAIEALLALTGPSPEMPIHRDLHDKQLIWDTHLGPGLIDLDTACLGDPALDLGNLRAHARLRQLQGLWPERRATVVRDVVDRAAARLDCPPPRVHAYERSTLVRLGCVYAFRPHWRRIAPALLDG